MGWALIGSSNTILSDTYRKRMEKRLDIDDFPVHFLINFKANGRHGVANNNKIKQQEIRLQLKH